MLLSLVSFFLEDLTEDRLPVDIFRLDFWEFTTFYDVSLLACLALVFYDEVTLTTLEDAA